MAFFRSRRSVPSPEPLISHGSTNPMFESSSSRLATVRSIAAWTLGTVAVGIAIGTWAYGPYFKITSVTVSGTTVVRPESIQAWVEHDIHRLRWLIVPQDHSVVLSTSQLSQRLHDVINKRLSVETVTVTTTDRHSLKVEIIERQALLIWESGEQRATVDRHGVIIAPLNADASASYPRVEDQTKLPIPTDASIISPEVVNGFTTLNELAKDIGITIDRFILPIPRCVLSSDTNTNAAIAEEKNVNEQSEKNISTTTNSSTVKNSNTNSGVEMTIGTCENATARFNASDIWLQVSQGPVIYFDRHNDLNQAMDAVRRALEDTKNRSARYIDARFPGRIYVQ